MSSYYTYKHPIRQEGFHLPSPPPSNSNSTPPPQNNYDLFNNTNPAAFGDELASLMSNERGSPAMYDDYSHQRTHNIFDISAPTNASSLQMAGSASSTASFPATYNNHSQPSSYHHPTPTTHFNSTLPALGSSVRYEPERSRSRSRPPSGDAVGPQRTVRSRRGGSVSSTSPPPGKPGAIVIPGQAPRAQVGSPMSPGGTWFGSGSTSTPTTEYLPTPDSLHSHSIHHHHHQQSHQGYTPFSLPSPGGDMHLPPLAHHHKDMHRDIMSAPRDIMSSTGPRDIMSSPRDILHPQSSSYGISPPLSSSLTGALSSLGPLSPLTSPITPGMGMSQSIPVSTSLVNHNNNMTPQDKQALLANEKRRRRRESHNAVERRRRDNINEKISELATLIPECMLEGGTNTSPAPVSLDPDTLVPPTSAAAAAQAAQDKKDEEADGGVVKANKGMILRKSVEYIRYLQQLVTAQGARNRELEAELKAYRSGSVSSEGMDATSSESPRKEGDGEGEEEGMMLHDEEFGFASNSAEFAGTSNTNGNGNGEFGEWMDDDSSPDADGEDGRERDRERENGNARERGRRRELRRVKEEDEMVA